MGIPKHRAPLATLLAALALALALAGCTRAPERPLVRLVELAAAQAGAAGEGVTVAAGITVGAEPHHLEVQLSGARTGRLVLTARGDAPLLEIAWKLDGERRFQPYRVLSVPLLTDGEEHRYEVDLSAEPYWTGAITALRLGVEEGRLEVAELQGRPEGARVRTTALGGLSLPSLPGLGRLELELPEDAPRRAAFEVHLGLLPRFDHPGVTARFRVLSDDGTAWLDEELAGGGEGWRRARRQVEVPPSGRLTLEVEARRGGEPLPEGAAVWGAPVLVAPEAPAGPHLVVLVIDTLRADVVGAWGDPSSLTPSLDRLAAASVRFDRLYAPSPWTLPSVATLLTGYQPQTHGAGQPLEGFVPTALGPVPFTLAEALAGAGFYTAAVYNNIFLGPSFGLDRGFDEYDWLEREDDALVDRALELLDRTTADRRLFLLLHLFGPHNPYAPPGDACEMARELLAAEASHTFEAGGVSRGRSAREARLSTARSDTPPAFPGCSADRRPGLPVPPPEDRPWIETLYRAEVAFTDRQVGRLLDGLEERGLTGSTVLAVASDHGEDFWGRLEKMQERGYHDADHGHAHYGELLRVVGMIRAPALAPRVVEEPVELVDLAPTLLGLLDLPPPDPGAGGAEGGEALLQGADLGPVLAGGRPPRRLLISDFLLYGPSRFAVRRGPWKLVVPRPEGLAPELYHLEDDPGELVDLYAERPDIAGPLRGMGEEELARRGEQRRRLAGDDALHAAHLQWNHITKLRALGYLK